LSLSFKTLDAVRADDVFPVSLENISGTGAGCWVRRELRAETGVYLREFTAGGPRPWIGARVAHCTPGVRGFYLGVAFDHPPGSPKASAELDGSRTNARSGLFGWLRRRLAWS
jgi:hypothetical protein